jgi:HEAT repeat protein
MDGRAAAAVVCALAGSAWALMAVATLARRARFARRARAEAAAPAPLLPPERADRYGWTDEAWVDHLGPAAEPAPTAAEPEDRVLLRQALRSREPAVRRAAVTALGRLGEHHDWAIDWLIEALAEGRDTPARVAAELDRLASRVGTRLVPLLGHPSSVVRFYAVRLLARHGEVGRRLAAGLVHDPSANVRAAALETLRTVDSGEALRSALRLLEDPNPHVRAHACRTACSIAGASAAPFVVPLLADDSPPVRDAAAKALVSAGRKVAPSLLPVLDHQDEGVRSRAALVLQDVGIVDELLSRGDDHAALERIFAAGGDRLRAAAAERARRRVALRGHLRPLPSGADA